MTSGGEIKRSQADRKVMISDDQKRVLDYKREGLTFRQIATEMSMSVGWVHLRFTEALAFRNEGVASEFRDEQIKRLEMLRAAALDIVSNPPPMATAKGDLVRDDLGDSIPDESVKLAAIREVDRLDDREAKLLGLYPAVKVQMDAQVNYTVTTDVDLENLK